MRRALVTSLFVVALTGTSLGQQSAAPPSLRFEVASIKPSDTSLAARGYAGALIGRRWLATNTTLRDLIRLVQNMWLPEQVVGGPSWMDRDRYDIVATVDGTPSPAEATAMARALLEERFSLRAHIESRELTSYELSLARPGTLGPRLKPRRHCARRMRGWLPARGHFPVTCTSRQPQRVIND